MNYQQRNIQIKIFKNRKLTIISKKFSTFQQKKKRSKKRKFLTLTSILILFIFENTNLIERSEESSIGADF
jgi:hypothetical protein